MLKIKTDEQLSKTIDILSQLGQSIFPNTERAITISADLVLRTWKGFAQGEFTDGKPSGVNFSGNIDYANSISIRSVSSLCKEIYSDSKIGESIHNGSPEYDMKPKLVAGPKARVTKKGEAYNIIPFQHKTAELKSIKMPSGNLYQDALRLNKQKITGFRIDTNGIKRFTYAGHWDKISNAPKNLKGLTRVDTSAGKSSSSLYLTFRIVKLSQIGKWIRKAIPAWNIIEEVRKKTEPQINQLVTDALYKDLQNP